MGPKVHASLPFIIYQWYVQPLDIKWDYFVCYRGIRYSTPNGYTLPAFLRQETLSMIMILTGVSTIPNSTYISSPIFKGCTLHKCCDLGWHICYCTVKEGSHILVEVMGAVFIHHYSRGSAWWLDIPRNLGTIARHLSLRDEIYKKIFWGIKSLPKVIFLVPKGKILFSFCLKCISRKIIFTFTITNPTSERKICKSAYFHS